MRRISSFLFHLLFLCGLSHASDTFILTYTDCKLLGNTENSIEVKEGTKGKSTCIRNKSGVTCSSEGLKGEVIGDSTDYEIVFDSNDILFLDSGNIKLILNMADKQFIYGSVHGVLEKGLIISKNCVGTITTK